MTTVYISHLFTSLAGWLVSSKNLLARKTFNWTQIINSLAFWYIFGYILFLNILCGISQIWSLNLVLENSTVFLGLKCSGCTLSWAYMYMIRKKWHIIFSYFFLLCSAFWNNDTTLSWGWEEGERVRLGRLYWMGVCFGRPSGTLGPGAVHSGECEHNSRTRMDVQCGFSLLSICYLNMARPRSAHVSFFNICTTLFIQSVALPVVRTRVKTNVCECDRTSWKMKWFHIWRRVKKTPWIMHRSL